MVYAALATLFACAAASAYAQPAPLGLVGDLPIERLPENHDLRLELWERFVAAPRDRALVFQAEERRNPWSDWRVSLERTEGAFYAAFSPRREGSYPLYGQGSWIIKRSLVDGSFMQAKVYLRSEQDSFARIYPHGERTRMDIVVYGAVLYRNVNLPLSMEQVLRSPFSTIRRLSADQVDWGLFSPDPALYAETRSLAASIRAGLPGLRYADDGAIDADGRAVFIASLLPQGAEAGLNCSGFVKWIADGTLYPIAGSYLEVDALRRRMVDWRGSSFTLKFEESHDPFFGLDWSRALARELWAAFYPSRRDPSPLAHDVDESPFTLIVGPSAAAGTRARAADAGSNYLPYPINFEDAGYDLRGLTAMLYVLAIREPGRWYLAALNARMQSPPRLRRYFHIAALFPYFDADGSFRVAVFESAAETSLARIVNSPSYEFTKLIRMPSSARFRPPFLPAPF